MISREMFSARTRRGLKERMCFWILLVLGLVTREMQVLGNPNEAVISAQGSINVGSMAGSASEVSYGVDVSWPMHHEAVTFDRPNPLDSQARHYIYKEFMQGCIGDETQPLNKLEECRRWESERIAMNLQQPAISENYTHAGFAKVATPMIVRTILQDLWDEHKGSQVMELWERGNTYLNHWQSPTHMVDIARILSQADQWEMVKAVQSVIEAWTQQTLVLTSLYGIRVYGSNAILSPHVDRLPLVSSAIINVAQDVEEPWVLELVGHDGKVTNVTMEPWDMVLYESHSVIHGRPFPLKGKYYANLFVHFEPLGHSFRHMQRAPQESAKVAFERAKAKLSQAQRDNEGEGDKENSKRPDTSAPSGALPYYVPPDKEERWRQQFEFEKEKEIYPKPTRVTLGNFNPHHAAADGSLQLLKEMAAHDQRLLFKQDHNGWRPLHEAARAGRTEVVEYLLEQGAEVNERTNQGKGASPLWWAEKKPKENAKTIALLKKYNGVALAPISQEQKAKEDQKSTDKKDEIKV